MVAEIIGNKINSSLEIESKKFTIKRMLKAIFKKKKQIIKKSIDDNMEISENTANDKIYEIEYPEEEVAENTANDKIYEIEYPEEEKSFDMIPVNFISTEHGTFFWTTDNPNEPDADLIQPLYCCTSSQLALSQY
ncbi:malpha family protein [Megaselia abdita]